MSEEIEYNNELEELRSSNKDINIQILRQLKKINNKLDQLIAKP